MCTSSVNVEAAHIVRRDAPDALLQEGGLCGSSWHASNGIILCRTCHVEFDGHLWRVVPQSAPEPCEVVELDSSLVHVPHFAGLDGRRLRRPALETQLEVWPPPRRWAVQSRLFDVVHAERARHVEDHPFVCLLCLKRFRSEKGLQAHHRIKHDVPQHMRLDGWLTPIERRAFPHVVAAVRQPVFAEGETEDGEASGDGVGMDYAGGRGASGGDA